MTTYLHVGTGKTGTTSIQVFLEENAQKLRAEHGIVVPDFAGRRNHRHLTLYSLDDGVVDNLRRDKKLTTQPQIDQFRKAFRKRFVRGVADFEPGERVVFTSEQMVRLRTQTSIERLRDLLAVYTRDVKVIVYFRRQDSYLISEYSQLVKGGNRTTLDQEPGKRIGSYDHYTFAKRWADVFGRENVIVRVFERGQLVDGDVVADFMSILGVNDLTGFTRAPADRNLSLDIHTVEFLRRLNEHLPRWFEDGSPNPARHELIQAVEAISKGPRIALDGERAVSFMTTFAKSNAAVAREFLGREDGVLFREPLGTGELSSPTLDLDKALELAAGVYLHMFRKWKDAEAATAAAATAAAAATTGTAAG